MLKTWSSKIRLFFILPLTLLAAGVGPSTLVAMLELNGEVLRQAAEALTQSRLALDVAREATDKAISFQADFDIAIMNAEQSAGNKLDQKIQAAGAEFNRRIEQAAKDVAEQVARQVDMSAQNAQYYADQAAEQAGLAEQHAVALEQQVNAVQQRINDAFHELEPRMQDVGVQHAVAHEQARQQVRALHQEQRNNNALQLYRQQEAIRVQNDLQLEQQRAQHERIRDQELVRLQQEARLSDMTKAGAVTVATLAGLFFAAYGVPALVNYFTRPSVIYETSRCGWFGGAAAINGAEIDHLIFNQDLQATLTDLTLTVKEAGEYGDVFPNALFFGVPGTGKTAFAKALAKSSGLDYALTSGSEFAKITDPSLQISELRKLIEWGKSSDNGVLIFIDEAESLFQGQGGLTKSSDISLITKEFLALVPDRLQKKIMFIFATNHPHKLDVALLDRIGIAVQFTLPGLDERVQILKFYLDQFALVEKMLPVQLSEKVIDALPDYARALEGQSPRAIKFVAEQIVARMRRNQKSCVLDDETVWNVIHRAQESHQTIAGWDSERERWIRASQ